MPSEKRKEINSIATTVTLPSQLRNDKKLNQAIAYGFNSRSEFYQRAMIVLSHLVKRFGLEKGVTEMQKRLEVM